MTIPQLPPESEAFWKYDDEQISPRVVVETTHVATPIPETPIKWFTAIMPFGGDTDKEKEEYRNAQIEQLKLGILKMQQAAPQMPTTQMNFQGGSIGQPLQIGKAVDFSELPVEKKIEKISNKTLDSLMAPIGGKKAKIGPNEPCHCGSGRKFKRCHGRGQFN
jgi:hypothetical protein